MNRVPRADVCVQLSELFKPPDRALADDVGDGRLADFFPPRRG